MTEGERVQLYNDLCDWRDALAEITFPPQTKNIDILSRAITYVRGDTAKWLRTEASKTQVIGDRTHLAPVACSRCSFPRGSSDFRVCPQCGAKMNLR